MTLLVRAYDGKLVGTYKYKYNGKELQEELGLNMYDYGARNYDPALGRFFNVDPLAEKHGDFTPYAYVLNNPLRYIDPTGMTEEEGDPGKKSFWQKVKGWFSSKKSNGTVYVGEVKECEPPKPELFSPEWFESIFSFDSYKTSYQDSELNKERDIFINKSLPEIAEGSREVIDYAGVVPGVDIITSLYIYEDYQQAGINTVLTFGGAVFKVGKTGIVANALSKNFKLISPSLLKSAGIDAHALKYEFLGKNAKISSYDLYKCTETNEILILAKGGKGLPIPTGEFIH